jgi:hypothetical protein
MNGWEGGTIEGYKRHIYVANGQKNREGEAKEGRSKGRENIYKY